MRVIFKPFPQSLVRLPRPSASISEDQRLNSVSSVRRFGVPALAGGASACRIALNTSKVVVFAHPPPPEGGTPCFNPFCGQISSPICVHGRPSAVKFSVPLCVLRALRVRNSFPVRVFCVIRGHGLSLCVFARPCAFALKPVSHLQFSRSRLEFQHSVTPSLRHSTSFLSDIRPIISSFPLSPPLNAFFCVFCAFLWSTPFPSTFCIRNSTLKISCDLGQLLSHLPCYA